MDKRNPIPMATHTLMAEPIDPLGLQRLFQLASPSLPVGGFAYSEGLETMIATGALNSAGAVEDWIGGVLVYSLAVLDVPVLLRLHAAWQADDQEQVIAWSQYLIAARETSERRQQERHVGTAMATLLYNLEFPDATDWRIGSPNARCATFATMLSLAAVRWSLSAENTASVFVWNWLETQVLAAVKLVPLGQTAGQAMLSRLAERVPAVMANAAALADDDIVGSLPGLTLASARHEQLYSRLFRS